MSCASFEDGCPAESTGKSLFDEEEPVGQAAVDRGRGRSRDRLSSRTHSWLVAPVMLI